MNEQSLPVAVDHDMAADILMNLADLMRRYHERDVALQHALSGLGSETIASPEMHELQHIDLLTQTHADLAQLLPVLSACVRGERMGIEELKNSLTLRSLRNSLIERESDQPGPEAGELSLF